MQTIKFLCLLILPYKPSSLATGEFRCYTNLASHLSLKIQKPTHLLSESDKVSFVLIKCYIMYWLYTYLRGVDNFRELGVGREVLEPVEAL